VIDALRKISSPSVANAIETFNVRPRNQGQMSSEIRTLFPEMGPMVGYAVTSVTQACKPEGACPDLTADYLRYVTAQPGPKVAVGQDLDPSPGLGAQFGEVNATIHQKLGCVGHVTDGCPRDLDEVDTLGFHLFGLNPCVSHAYVHPVRWGCAVEVFGRRIHPGDLIHADKHGFLVIPPEDQGRLFEAACFMDANECATLIAAARSAQGKSAEQVLSDMDAAALEFAAATRKQFSRAAEF